MQSKTYRYLKGSSIVKKLRAYKQRIIIKRNHDLSDVQEVQEVKKIQEVQEKNDKINVNPLAGGYTNLRKYYIDILNNIDFIHYNSTVSKRIYEKYIDNTKGKVLNITHSDIKDNRIQKHSNNNEPLKITYIGSIEKYKGLYFLLNVLEELVKNNINRWKLNVYGKNVKIGRAHV